nr:hypothetical protein GCM10020063_096100 [Dactylosporangium thailandense]
MGAFVSWRRVVLGVFVRPLKGRVECSKEPSVEVGGPNGAGASGWRRAVTRIEPSERGELSMGSSGAWVERCVGPAVPRGVRNGGAARGWWRRARSRWVPGGLCERHSRLRKRLGTHYAAWCGTDDRRML